MGNIRESARKYTLKVLTKIFRKPYNDLTEGFVELRDQQANDYVRDQIHQAKNGLMVSKWGTTELGTVCSLCTYNWFYILFYLGGGCFCGGLLDRCCTQLLFLQK